MKMYLIPKCDIEGLDINGGRGLQFKCGKEYLVRHSPLYGNPYLLDEFNQKIYFGTECKMLLDVTAIWKDN